MEMEKVDYAAWIGMDWGSYQHAICLQAAGSSSVARHTLEQKPEALHAWATNLRAHFGGAKVAIAIEQTRGAVIHFLLGFDFVHVFTIHPKSLKNYREALHPSGAKDDPTDAELLLQFAMAHQDKIKPWAPAEPEIRLLLRLSEFRRKTVGKRVRLTNELTQLLKEYFPAALDCAGELDTVMACDFLLKWPTLEKLQKSQPETIRRFYQEHGSRRRDVIEDRLKQIRSALPLTTDAPVIEPSVFLVQSIVPQLHSVIDAIAQFDQRIKEVFEKHPDAPIFSSFPGAGPALAYRWIRIIYRCWKDRVPYDEDKYVKSLRQRKPAWLQSLPFSES